MSDLRKFLEKIAKIDKTIQDAIREAKVEASKVFRKGRRVHWRQYINGPIHKGQCNGRSDWLFRQGIYIGITSPFSPGRHFFISESSIVRIYPEKKEKKKRKSKSER